jgi:FkbM family methyltransferase
VAFKTKLQARLSQAGLYHRVRASFLYDLYWSFADRTILDTRAREVEFYRALLKGFPKGGVIFDIGANHGTKTAIFLRLGAKVVAVDPDDANQRALEDAFLRYRVVPRPVTVIRKAASDSSALQTFWIDEPGSAKNTLSRKWVGTLRDDQNRFGRPIQFATMKQVETVTLDQLIEAHGVPYLVKIDVEGHEPSVLRGLHRPVPYLSFEVNLPEFREEGLACVGRLRELAARGRFNYTVDCGQGLALDEWLDAKNFSEVLRTCTAESIEVVWESDPKP